MKKLILRCTMGFIPLIAICSSTLAQTSKVSTSFNGSPSTEVAYVDHVSSSTNAGSATALINAKALKSFSRSHQKQANANWFVIGDGFLAQFKDQGVTTKVYYDKKGRWTADLRTYTEEFLPTYTRSQVKSCYYDYDIIIVNEVKTIHGTAYLVKIQDKKSIKTIKIMDDEMSETESFRRK